MPGSPSHQNGRIAGAAGFTLLEILMALALAAVLAAAAAPLLSDALSRSQTDDAVSAVEDAALALHAGAVEAGARRPAAISPAGLVPGRPLPSGWKLEVRRLAESRFRKPREGEQWEFNDAGICEPLELRLSGGGESVELRFDPLTAQTIDD